MPERRNWWSRVRAGRRANPGRGSADRPEALPAATERAAHWLERIRQRTADPR